MSDTVIRVENLGKRYHIGKRERYRALRDVLTETVTAPLRWLRGAGNGSADSGPEQIWALKDVSFEVKRGEVVGIIGRNGAGKSTLLKILSRITDPIEGRAEIRGRVGSLLEVGAGFHSELTGRENIYLNGAILGMHKTEIDQYFDSITGFAEVSDFIDTPLKHYSSGMQLRLGFSIAAHLNADIVLADEVLAVGDLGFQNRSLGRMRVLAESGRTILFVSHNLNQIRRICRTCIWLDNGRVRAYGQTGEVVSTYESWCNKGTKQEGTEANHLEGRPGFFSWWVIHPENDGPHSISTMGPVVIAFKLRLEQRIHHGHHGLVLYGPDGAVAWGASQDGLRLEPGIIRFVYRLPGLPLKPGPYTWLVHISDEGVELDTWMAYPPLIISTVPYGHRTDRWQGLLNIQYTFEIQESAH